MYLARFTITFIIGMLLFYRTAEKNPGLQNFTFLIQLLFLYFRKCCVLPGKNPSGKRKGGIKAHTLIRKSDQDVPCIIRYSAAAANDSQFLKEVYLPKGSILVFDRGYHDYKTFNRFANDNITRVTRRRKQLTYKVLQEYKKHNDDETIISDEKIQLGCRSGTKVAARLVRYKDLASGELYEFISNNFRMKAITIARLYAKVGR